MSAPQHIGVGAPIGRLAGVGEQTCRLPSKLSPLGTRGVNTEPSQGSGPGICRRCSSINNTTLFTNKIT